MIKPPVTKYKYPLSTAWIAVFNQIMKQVRDNVKGLRTRQISLILIVGDREGISSADVGKMLDVVQNNAWMQLKRAIDTGWICKQGKGYHLTDKGRIVYNKVNELWKPSMDALARWCAERAVNP